MQEIFLYTVKGYKGAHMLKGLKECQVTETPGAEPTTRTFADVQLIGALLGFSAPLEDLTPYTLDNKNDSSDIIIQLAQESVTLYNQDPKRVQKAADLARDPYAIQPARRDMLDNPIKPTYKRLIVKGSKGGWYFVENGQCNCEDNRRGQTCKHRIAAWMRRETIARPLAQTRRTTTKKILAEMEA